MASLIVDIEGPSGYERLNLKIIRKYNIRPNEKELRYRERPRHSIAGAVIGKNVSNEEAREYLINNLVKEYSIIRSFRLQI